MRILFLIFFTMISTASYAASGDVYPGKNAIELIEKGKVLKEWVSGPNFNMLITHKGQHYTCSIYVKSEMYGTVRTWCVSLY